VALAASIAHAAHPSHAVEAAPVEVADPRADRGSTVEL
jgi:hypothetical protein